jgi:tripeptide aminopeptidase
VVYYFKEKVMNMNIKERFIQYVKIDTQSDPNSLSSPSTLKQLDLSKLLVEELKELKATSVVLDQYGVVYAHIPANVEGAKTIGLVAHVDTAGEMSGKNVKPRLINNYQGTDIVLNETKNIVMKVDEFPHLKRVIGQDIIVTDGTTLLGADDKAGVAIIMEVVKYLKEHPEIPHGDIKIAFTPDEEIGRGVENFDVDSIKADFAYTLDGSDMQVLNFENFNAASADVVIKGNSFHPGDAKDKMVNAILVAMAFNALLPKEDVPHLTEGYQGFNHITHIEGEVEGAKMHYIIRNHDIDKLENQKEDFLRAAAELNTQYGEGTVSLTLKDSYRNMGPLLKANPEALNRVYDTYKRLGIEVVALPIRGGTDGAQLSYKGLLTPNLGTGGYNFHGKYEFVSLTQMERMVQVVVDLVTHRE